MILFILCFFCITYFIIAASYNSVITEKLHTLINSYTATISSSLTLLEENTRETASILKNSEDVQTALSASSYDINTEFEYDQAIRSRIVNTMHVNSAIRMIYVGNENYNCYYSMGIGRPETEYLYLVIKDCLTGYNENTMYSGIWITASRLGFPPDSSSLFFIQKVRNLNSIRPIGYILIEVDSSFLDEAVNSTAFETDTDIAFLKESHLLYQNGSHFSEDEVIALEKEYLQTPNPSSAAFTVGKEKYYVTRNYNDSLDLSVLSMISYRDFMEESRLLHMGIIMLILLFFLFLLMVGYYFSNRIVKQVSLIKDIFSSNLISGYPASHPNFRDDEIGQIGRECETLLQKYHDSLNQTYALNVKQKESELLRLQEQINPHFLYNTLDSIFWMCETKGNRDAAQMSLYLSRYFRSNLGKDELTISIQEEINSIQNYLAIQNIRYKDKFHFITEVPENLYSKKILRMLVQPLIENAIVHGLEPKVGIGTIRLSVFSNGPNLILAVQDDGVGFATDDLQKGLALRNIDERIKLFYGNSYGMQIIGQPDVGTTVTLTLSMEDLNHV